MPLATADRCPKCRAGPLFDEPDQSRSCYLCGYYEAPPEPEPPQCSRPRCANPTTPPFRTCQSCRERERNRNRRTRKDRRQQSQCRKKSCPNPLPPGSKTALCAPCQEQNRAARRQLYADRKAAGYCGHCGKVPPLPGYVLCETCHEGNHEQIQRRKDQARARQVNPPSRGIAIA